MINTLYKTIYKIKQLEKESPHVGKTERPQEEERRSHKGMPRYHTDLASRHARTHATQTQTRNTISRLGPRALSPQPPILYTILA